MDKLNTDIWWIVLTWQPQIHKDGEFWAAPTRMCLLFTCQHDDNSLRFRDINYLLARIFATWTYFENHQSFRAFSGCRGWGLTRMSSSRERLCHLSYRRGWDDLVIQTPTERGCEFWCKTVEVDLHYFSMLLNMVLRCAKSFTPQHSKLVYLGVIFVRPQESFVI
jgi:hypothetical protein